MFVKVCGITSVEDALMMLRFRVDAVGLVFHRKSPRFVDADMALKIVELLKGRTRLVAVFKYKSELKECERMLELFDFVQLYEPVPQLCHKLILGTHGGTEEKAAFYLLDASHGRGIRVDYPLDLFGLPRDKTIISGGLTPYNVDYVVARYRPYGVDVSSGVELRKGVKSYYLLEAFLDSVRRA